MLPRGAAFAQTRVGGAQAGVRESFFLPWSGELGNSATDPPWRGETGAWILPVKDQYPSPPPPLTSCGPGQWKLEKKKKIVSQLECKGRSALFPGGEMDWAGGASWE